MKMNSSRVWVYGLLRYEELAALFVVNAVDIYFRAIHRRCFCVLYIYNAFIYLAQIIIYYRTIIVTEKYIVHYRKINMLTN